MQAALPSFSKSIRILLGLPKSPSKIRKKGGAPFARRLAHRDPLRPGNPGGRATAGHPPGGKAKGTPAEGGGKANLYMSESCFITGGGFGRETLTSPST